MRVKKQASASKPATLRNPLVLGGLTICDVIAWPHPATAVGVNLHGTELVPTVMSLKMQEAPGLLELQLAGTCEAASVYRVGLIKPKPELGLFFCRTSAMMPAKACVETEVPPTAEKFWKGEFKSQAALFVS